MSIIITKNQKEAKRIKESNFELEDNLQEYILINPETIPIYEIEEEAKLLIAAREFSTNSGPIDGLGFDQYGNIYVVETKLFKNPDKRIVVAQALDYGASLWRHSGNIDDFYASLNKHTYKNFGQPFNELIQDFFGLLEEELEVVLESIKINLNSGQIKYVILMDKLDDRLKDLITYVNQNSKFDIYAIDLKYYQYDKFEILIPKIYGTEAKKELSVSRKQVQNWIRKTKKDFLIDLDNRIAKKMITNTNKEQILEIFKVIEDISDKTNQTVNVSYNKTKTMEYIGIYLKDEDFKTSLFLTTDGRFAAYPGKAGTKEGIQIDFIKELLNQIIKKGILNKDESTKDQTQWIVHLLDKPDETKKLIEIMKKLEKKII